MSLHYPEYPRYFIREEDAPWQEVNKKQFTAVAQTYCGSSAFAFSFQQASGVVIKSPAELAAFFATHEVSQ